MDGRLSVLFDTYEDKLYRIARRLSSNAEDAQDLVQETFLRGAQSLSSIPPGSDADAWLVLSDTYYTGWTASIDGQPTTVLRGDVLFRVVAVPGGEHDVEFRFEPISVKLGVAISLVSLAVVVAGLVLAGRAGRPRRTT